MQALHLGHQLTTKGRLTGPWHWAHERRAAVIVCTFSDLCLKKHLVFFTALTFGDPNIAFVLAMRPSRNKIPACLDNKMLRLLRGPDVVL